MPKVLGKRNVQALAVGAQGHVYLGLEDRSMQVSTDNGATWAYAGQGIDDWTKANTGSTDNTALSLALAADGSLVGGLEHFGTREDVALNRSTDGGMTWTQVGQEVTRVAKSKSSNAQMLSVEITSLASNARGHLFAGAEGLYGLFRSIDGGQTWKHVGPVPTHHYTGVNPQVLGIAFAPDGLVYIATRTDGIWRSADNGETWQKLSYVEDDVRAITAAPDGSVYAEGPDGNVFRLAK